MRLPPLARGVALLPSCSRLPGTRKVGILAKVRTEQCPTTHPPHSLHRFGTRLSIFISPAVRAKVPVPVISARERLQQCILTVHAELDGLRSGRQALLAIDDGERTA